MRTVMTVCLTLGVACSRDFQPYGWEDSCSCVRADGGTAANWESFVVCKEEFETPGGRTTYVCSAAAGLADAGCTTPPSCTCQPKTLFYCIRRRSVGAGAVTWRPRQPSFASWVR